MANNANNTKLINEASRKIGEFSGVTGWKCKLWAHKFRHTCEYFQLSASIQRQTFAACMEGDALRWYTGLDDEVKESLDQTFEALFEEFVPRAAFQAELEKEYLKLRHNRGQSVNEFGRDLMLVVGEMDDPPSMAKQIIHFKKGLLPSIKRKMEIREYLDLADIITQAKLVEADCINELSEEFDSGLTKGMFKRGGDNTLFLGIQ